MKTRPGALPHRMKDQPMYPVDFSVEDLQALSQCLGAIEISSVRANRDVLGVRPIQAAMNAIREAKEIIDFIAEDESTWDDLHAAMEQKEREICDEMIFTFRTGIPVLKEATFLDPKDAPKAPDPAPEEPEVDPKEEETFSIFLTLSGKATANRAIKDAEDRAQGFRAIALIAGSLAEGSEAELFRGYKLNAEKDAEMWEGRAQRLQAFLDKQKAEA